MSSGRISRAIVVAVIGLFAGMGLMSGVAGAKSKKPNAPKTTESAAFKARGSIGEVYVVNAEQGDQLMLVSPKNKVLRTSTADRFGSKIFYYIKPGPGYTVRLKKDGEVYGTKRVQGAPHGRKPEAVLLRRN